MLETKEIVMRHKETNQDWLGYRILELIKMEFTVASQELNHGSVEKTNMAHYCASADQQRARGIV
jgi:hypothetical protein